MALTKQRHSVSSETSNGHDWHHDASNTGFCCELTNEASNREGCLRGFSYKDIKYLSSARVSLH